jgi:pyruvate, water dikinase
MGIVLFCGCAGSHGSGGADTEPEESTDTAHLTALEIHIALDDDESLSDYSVSAVFDNEQAARVFCSKKEAIEAEGIACRDFGVEITVPKSFEAFESLYLTVKRRGYAFFTEQLTPDRFEDEDTKKVFEVSLFSLSAIEITDDYRTGFDQDDLEAFEESAYRSESDMGPLLAAKFVIADLATEPIVYFQNTKRNPTHYDFVRNVLGINMTSSEFYKATYAGEDRRFMAGTLLLYESLDAPSARLDRTVSQPVMLTFFPSDDLTVVQARTAFRLIEERLGFSPLQGDVNRFFYLPAGEQKENDLLEDTALFARWDEDWMLLCELYRQVELQIMNQGLAYGTLRLADADALRDGVFSYRDILVLPSLPVALPIVGGTITEEFQTPLAHVNVMAKNRDTPNMTLRDASSKSEIEELLGKLVRFEVKKGAYTLEETTAEEAEAFYASQTHEPIVLDGDLSYEELPLFDDIGFDDFSRVGAKAANLAELHQLLGDKAPMGFAVPFVYYQRALESTMVSAASCEAVRADCIAGREESICERAESICELSADLPLSGYIDALLEDEEVASDTVLRDAVLAGLRALIAESEVDPTFVALLDNRAAEVFGASQVRLRSSTNAEDVPGFSGAGLYDSVSVHLEEGESASAMIRMVWASVWNWRAFEERSYWNIDHRSTYMGIAVNPAFDNEAANGVLITQNVANLTVAGMYVNVQEGEISVTNPAGFVVPEIFSIIPGPTPGTVQAARLGFSSLSPSEPIMTDDEISALYETATIVHNHFADLYGESPTILAMDLEFKLIGEDRDLIIKQARPYSY